MVRSFFNVKFFNKSFPRARGDGPDDDDAEALSAEFSPRAWGWSGNPGYRRAGQEVIPAPVGMVRVVDVEYDESARFPRARGDGPKPRFINDENISLSPRPWGWSGNKNEL